MNRDGAMKNNRPSRFKGLLPPVGRLASDEVAAFDRFRQLFDLRDAVVVEIGGALPAAWVKDANVQAWHAVDPRDMGDRGETPPVVRHRVPILDFTLTGTACDLFFSSNAFQHVHGFREVLDHLASMAQPGAWLYANFGPIWSAPDGSHIEDLVFEGKTHQFWDGPLHPPWAHLVSSEEELAEQLTPRHGQPFARAIAEYIHRSTWINRQFLWEYQAAIADSPWEMAAFHGCADFGYAAYPPGWLEEESTRRRLEFLMHRHGQPAESFLARDLEVILRLPRGTAFA